MASLPIISARGLKTHIGSQEVLAGATLSVSAGERVGIVGRNGCGKSTFLKALAEVDSIHEGEISRRRGAICGYLPQQFDLDPEKSVRESVLDGAAPLLELIRAYEEDADEDAGEAVARLDGWRLDSRIDSLLSQLKAPEAERSVTPLSGGEKRRVALCRALASNPDLLLLDEPTNHLDMESIDWLAGYLASYSGAVILITHDRWFLDRVCTSIVELRGGTFDQYPGSYTKFIERKAEMLSAEAKHEHNRQQFLKREIEWVRRGPPARTTKSQSRLDRYAEIKHAAGPIREDQVDMLFPDPPRLGNKVLSGSGLRKSLGGKLLFENLDITFEAGMRLGVVGPNGVGKSTLLRILFGELEPDAGTVECAETVEVNWMDQERTTVSDSQTVFQETGGGNEMIPFGGRTTSTRGYLKRFLFSDDRINARISHLSGGERSRLVLAKMCMRGGNVLVLDEPTNDLDLSTLRVLEQSLEDFAGCIALVSHDRMFLNRVCTHTLVFEGSGNVQFHVGNYDYYLEQHAPRAKTKAAPPKPVETKAPEAPRQKLSYKEQREFENLEAEIEAKEALIEEIAAQFADPDWCRDHAGDIADASKKLATLRSEAEQMYARWEELAARA